MDILRHAVLYMLLHLFTSKCKSIISSFWESVTNLGTPTGLQSLQCPASDSPTLGPRTILLCLLVVARGGSFLIEQPMTSVMSHYHRFEWMTSRFQVLWLHSRTKNQPGVYIYIYVYIYMYACICIHGMAPVYIYIYTWTNFIWAVCWLVLIGLDHCHPSISLKCVHIYIYIYRLRI